MDRAIAAIASGGSFYFEIGRRELPAIVAVSRYGSRYLKGAGDTRQRETLPALPEGALPGDVYAVAGASSTARILAAGLGISRNSAHTTAEITQRKASP